MLAQPIFIISPTWFLIDEGLVVENISNRIVNTTQRNRAELIALKAGNYQSFLSILNRQNPIIYNFSLRILQNEVLAEEATADVFIKLWEKKTIINPDKPIEAFLYKLAKDICFNYLKKLAREKKLVKSFIKNYTGGSFKSSEDLYLEQEELNEIEEIISSLSPKRLEVFRLKYFQDLNNQEIATSLDISLNTVRVHLTKARLHLKNQLLKKKKMNP